MRYFGIVAARANEELVDCPKPNFSFVLRFVNEQFFAVQLDGATLRSCFVNEYCFKDETETKSFSRLEQGEFHPAASKIFTPQNP